MVLKKEYIKKTNQRFLFQEIMTRLLNLSHRSCFEQFYADISMADSSKTKQLTLKQSHFLESTGKRNTL